MWSLCLMTLKGHSKEVTSVAVSPDGTRIVSGSKDGTLRVWDSGNGEVIAVLRGHPHGVRAVAYTRDGARIASGGFLEGRMCLWDATTFHELLELRGHRRSVNSVSSSPEGDRIASGSDDHSVRIWDVSTGDCLATLEGHPEAVESVAFFPDGLRLALSSCDRVHIWDLATRDCITILEDQSRYVRFTALSPDGSRIMYRSGFDTAAIRSVSDQASLVTLRGHTRPFASAVFSPAGDCIVSGSGDNTVRLWDATTGECLATFKGHTRDASTVDFSPNGRWIVSGSHDSTVKIWDASAVNQGTVQDTRFDPRTFQSLAFSSDGSRLASLGTGKLVQVIDTANGNVVVSFKARLGYALGWRADFSLDNSKLILHNDLPTLAMHLHKSQWGPFAFDAITGVPITDIEVTLADAYYPIHTPFALKDGRIMRHDVSPSQVICILPTFLSPTLTAFSEPINGEVRAAILCEDRLLILHVRL